MHADVNPLFLLAKAAFEPTFLLLGLATGGRWKTAGRSCRRWTTVTERDRSPGSRRRLDRTSVLWVCAFLLYCVAFVAVRAIAVTISFGDVQVLVNRTVLAAGIGTVRPRPGTIRTVRYTRVHGILRLMVMVLRVRAAVAGGGRLGLHATAVPLPGWAVVPAHVVVRSLAAIVTAPAGVRRLALRAGPGIVACRQTVGEWPASGLVGYRILTTKVAAPSAGVLVVRIVRLCGTTSVWMCLARWHDCNGPALAYDERLL